MAKPVSESSYDQLVTDPANKPKVLAKTFVQALKAIKAKATVTRAETVMPRNWDYGVIVELAVTIKNSSETTNVTLMLNVAASKQGRYGSDEPGECSGTASIGKGVGQVISTQRANNSAVVVTKLTSDLVAHLSARTESSIIRGMASLLETFNN